MCKDTIKFCIMQIFFDKNSKSPTPLKEWGMIITSKFNHALKSYTISFFLFLQLYIIIRNEYREKCSKKNKIIVQIHVQSFLSLLTNIKYQNTNKSTITAVPNRNSEDLSKDKSIMPPSITPANTNLIISIVRAAIIPIAFFRILICSLFFLFMLQSYNKKLYHANIF